MDTYDEMPQLKTIKLTKEEQLFTKEYRRLEDLEREKGIKFFQCVGDPPITDETRQHILMSRQHFIDEKNRIMRERDINRYNPAIDEERVVTDIDLELAEKPKWDAFENNHFAMRRRLVGIFLKVSNKLITRMRAGKRLAKIKNRLKSENVKSKEDAKRMVY